VLLHRRIKWYCVRDAMMRMRWGEVLYDMRREDVKVEIIEILIAFATNIKVDELL